MILRRNRIIKTRGFFCHFRNCIYFVQVIVHVSFFMQLIIKVHFLKNISLFKTNIGFCGVLKQEFL